MKSIQTLTVYLGSSGHARPVFKDAAIRLGHIIGEQGYNLVYGGMDAGLMGLVAKGALESGAQVTGIVPKRLLDIERIMAGLTETILVEDLWDRKKRMFTLADAIIALPGGFGTMDESLEVLYWGNLGHHNKPLVLVNVEGYWDDMVTYIKSLPDYHEKFLIVVEDVGDVIPALKNYKPLPYVDAPDHFPHFEDEITRETGEPILIDVPTIENSYYVICALGLKQLHRHKRAIGFLNQDGEFDALLRWFETAAKETFITKHCLELYTVGTDEATLREELKHQEYVEIDLHGEKWGPRKGEKEE